jgi:hypothetical protein
MSKPQSPLGRRRKQPARVHLRNDKARPQMRRGNRVLRHSFRCGGSPSTHDRAMEHHYAGQIFSVRVAALFFFSEASSPAIYVAAVAAG